MGHTKSSAVIRGFLLGGSALCAFGSFGAFGQPTGSSVVSGQVSIATPSAGSTVITQSTQKALIEWQNFSVPASATVQFNQPNSSAITLNRVVGTGASAINGTLLANGQIWLINPNGVLFGNGSTINVGGLIATTSDISNQDFAAGNYNFAIPSSNAGAAIVNQGAIQAAQGGSAVLSGQNVSNQGLIKANGGTVVLGGASTFAVDFNGDKLLSYAVTPQSATPANNTGGASSVSNSGTLSAAGGKILLTARAASNVADNVINNTGMIEAASVSAQNGEIILDAGPNGTVNDSGTLDASGKGAGQTGGNISLAGNTVAVGDGAVIDASGDAGGGNIAIGGDLHGAGPLPNAQTTTVGKAVVNANAVSTGNGGNVAIWSDGTTSVAAAISARGGAQSGNGGVVETSGATLSVGDATRVDTLAPMGNVGTWLLDPQNILVQTGGGTSLSGGTLALGTDPGLTDTVDPTTIVNALASSAVTLEATNIIRILSPVTYSSPNTLNLLSEGNIGFYASVQNTMASGGGAINVIAGWNGTTLPPSSLTASGVYGNNNGIIVVGGTNTVPGLGTATATTNVAVGSASGTTTFAASHIGINGSAAGFAQIGYHGAGGGNIVVLYTTGNLDMQEGPAIADYVLIGNGSLNGDVSGNITGDITVQDTVVGGSNELDLNLNSAPGQPWIGNFAGSGFSETGNVTVIIADEDDNEPAGVDYIKNIIEHDLAGGNFTLGQTRTGNSNDGDTVLYGDSAVFSTPFNFTLLDSGNVYVGGSLENTGTGTITLVAGWNGTTFGPALTTTPNAFGINGATIFVGAPDQKGDVVTGNIVLGGAGGTTILANGLVLDAANGSVLVGSAGNLTGGVNVMTGSGGVTLAGGSGSGDFAQIGNQGPLPANPPGGTISISTTGQVTLTGGSGPAAFAQIGDNSGAATSSSSYDNVAQVSVTSSHNTLVTGSGAGSYALIGNGDDQAVVTPPPPPPSNPPPSNPPPSTQTQVASDPVTIGFVAGQNATTSGLNNDATNINVNTVVLVVNPPTTNPGATTVTASLSSSSSSNPIATLTGQGGQNTEPPTSSDTATTTIASSLNGSGKPPISHPLIPGVLSQITQASATNNVHGIPPADQDFSSWGNEAFWQ